MAESTRPSSDALINANSAFRLLFLLSHPIDKVSGMVSLRIGTSVSRDGHPNVSLYACSTFFTLQIHGCETVIHRQRQPLLLIVIAVKTGASECELATELQWREGRLRE